MADILLEEIHLTLSAPSRLTPEERDAAQRVLSGRRFMGDLRRAVREVIARIPALSRVRLTVPR